MVGRDSELAVIGRLLTDAGEGRSGALFIEGDPGIGKTTLLDAARSLADGFTCLSAQGVEPEALLAHAALLELVMSLRPLLDEIPAPQADALRFALGWASPQGPVDRFLVAAATLSLLAAAAERQPVLVIVDDLQWLDRESAAAILFAARRLGPDAVAFVFSARSGSISPDLSRGIPVLNLVGLSPAAAIRLVPQGTVDAVVQRLVTGTEGNPLALLEVSQRLDGAQRLGAAPLPDPLPVGDRLQIYYEALLTGLSADGWRAVVLLALDESAGTSSTVTRALESGGSDPAAALDEGCECGVLVADPLGVHFRHPLLRTAVLRLATAAQQRDAHRALAGELPRDGPGRAWHLAEGCLGPDDSVAEELARVAAMHRSRLGFAAASAALERAARLTRSSGLAEQRLAAAAEDAFVAGDVVRTRALVARVLDGSTPVARGHALFTLGMLEQYAGSVPLSVDHLTAACDLLEGVLLVRALAEQTLARFRLNDLAGIGDCADRIDAMADRTDPEQRLLADFTGGVSLMLRGDPEAGRARLADARALALSEDLRHDPRALLLLGLSVGFSGELGDAVAQGSVRVDEVRRRGAIGILVPTLAILAAGRAWAGDHAGAFADAGEAAELADQLGYAADASVAVEMLAWQSAARGLHDEASDALARARALTDRAGTTSVAAHHALTAAFCALCRGDPAQVVEVLEDRLAADGGVGAVGEPLGVAPLLVEAYAGLGRNDEALGLSHRYAEVTGSSAPARTAAFVGRCRGITATRPDAAEAAFEVALDAHAEAGDRFETARTRMLYGARLRREGQRIAAREQLRLSHDAFAEMDLTHWARQAAHELAATGETARRGDQGTDQPLTSQETRVALLVAEGKSNKEVAAAMFLSPKTIEHHLGSVFRKRGFRSRSELAGAFARLSSTATEPLAES